MPRRPSAERAPQLEPQERAVAQTSSEDIAERAARVDRSPMVDKQLAALEKYETSLEEVSLKLDEINNDPELSAEQRSSRYEAQMKKQAVIEKSIAKTSQALLDKYRAYLDEGTIAGLEANLLEVPASAPADHSESVTDIVVEEPSPKPQKRATKAKSASPLSGKSRKQARSKKKAEALKTDEEDEAIDIDVSDFDAVTPTESAEEAVDIDVSDVDQPEEATESLVPEVDEPAPAAKRAPRTKKAVVPPVVVASEIAYASADKRLTQLQDRLTSFGLASTSYDDAWRIIQERAELDRTIDRLAADIDTVLAKKGAKKNDAADLRQQRRALMEQERALGQELIDLGIKAKDIDAVGELLQEQQDLTTEQDRLEEDTLRDIETRHASSADDEDEELNAFIDAGNKEQEILAELDPEGTFADVKREYQQTYKEWEALRADLGSDQNTLEEQGLEPLSTWDEFYNASAPQPVGFFQKLKHAVFPAIPPRIVMWKQLTDARAILASGNAGMSAGAKARVKASIRSVRGDRF